MMSNDFIHWLENNSFGTVAVDIFETMHPNSPDNCITVIDVSSPGIAESSCLAVDLYSLQVIVRNNSNTQARNQIKNIHKKFIGFSGSLVSGGDVISAKYVDLPAYSLGKDDKGRSEYTVTYNMRVESVGDSHRL